MEQFVGYKVDRLEAGDGRTYPRTGKNPRTHCPPAALIVRCVGDTVQVEYTAYLPDGTQGDDSSGQYPLNSVHSLDVLGWSA